MNESSGAGSPHLPCADESHSPRRVLVIGGASLVGSHLCDRLLADGAEVVAIDDLSRGTWANIAHLKREPRFAFVEHDVALPFDAKRVDDVFHLALPSTRETCK